MQRRRQCVGLLSLLLSSAVTVPIMPGHGLGTSLGAPPPTALGAPSDSVALGRGSAQDQARLTEQDPREPRAAPTPAMAASLRSEVLAGLRHQEWARLRAGGHRCGCRSCPTAQMRKQEQDGLAWLPRVAGTLGLPCGGLGPLSRP